MSNKLPALPTVQRVDGHPKVKEARQRVSEARDTFAKMHDDAAGAVALVRERKHALGVLQARVAMGEATQSEFDKAADQVRQIEARTAIYGDYEANKAEFLAPFYEAVEAARIEASDELQKQYDKALQARREVVEDTLRTALPILEEMLTMGEAMSRSNNNAALPADAHMRLPFPNSVMGGARRIVHAIKSSGLCK